MVLLDHGRTRALADQVGRQALRCIRCSACLNVCPVYERTGGHAYGSVYPGPIGAILNPLLRGVGDDDQVDSLPYASSLCGACFEVCPVRIDIPSVLVELRAQVVDAHRGGRTEQASREDADAHARAQCVADVSVPFAHGAEHEAVDARVQVAERPQFLAQRVDVVRGRRGGHERGLTAGSGLRGL